MKAEKRIVKELVENIQHMFNTFSDELSYYLKRLEEAETVEEVMMLKQRILEAWVGTLPLNGDACYFCIERRKGLKTDCSSCQYAEHHGLCNDKGSSWHKINSLKWKLYDLIADEYYGGEVYEQEADK